MGRETERERKRERETEREKARHLLVDQLVQVLAEEGAGCAWRRAPSQAW